MDIRNCTKHADGAPVRVIGCHAAISNPAHLAVATDNPEFCDVFLMLRKRVLERLPKILSILRIDEAAESFARSGKFFKAVNVVAFPGPSRRIRPAIPLPDAG